LPSNHENFCQPRTSPATAVRFDARDEKGQRSRGPASSSMVERRATIF
jgi:hypothetical protein